MRILGPLVVSCLLAGCFTTFDDTVQPVTVYVENSSKDALRFRVTAGDSDQVIVDMEKPSQQPAVKIALRRNVNGDEFEVKADELKFGASQTRTFPVALENYVVVNVYANHTMDMWHLDREPVFD